MPTHHIAVLMGGQSSEHEVSLNSGGKVMSHLNPARYRATPIRIERDGRWAFPDAAPQPIGPAIARLMELEVDCVFPALHGPGGEDGRLQGLLDVLGIPYVGSGCTASAIGIDKIRSKALVAYGGVRVADQIVVDAVTWRNTPGSVLDAIETRLGYPCVVKSPCQGSSLGMGIPSDRTACEAAIQDALRYGPDVLVEQFLKGVEVTCGVLHTEPGEPARALPVTEIRPVSSPYFDYHAKYTPGACQEITPAEISESDALAVQSMAVRAHTLVGCSGFSRSDMILLPDGPVWIEINTIPGLTETSLFPQACAAVGISYAAMLDRLIAAALHEHGRTP